MDLILPVKKVWFDQIKVGTKGAEYRLFNDYWRKRIEGRTFDRVIITLGYPKKSDTSRRLTFRWNGYTLMEIVHPEWGEQPKKVFSIWLRGRYRPSNGTEGDSFMSGWCNQCERDREYRETQNSSCEIVARAVAFDVEDEDYPEEWTYDDKNRPCCTAFVEEGDPIPFLDTKTIDMFDVSNT